MNHCLNKRSWLKGLMAAIIALTLNWTAPDAQAKQVVSGINLTPTVTNLSVVNGVLQAAGTVTAVINGQTVTAPFSGVPVDLTLAEDQANAVGCPILDLHLGPINLNLLGLVVETSEICLQLNAYEGALLGDLLCGVSGLLGGGLSIEDILAGTGLVDPLTNLPLTPGLAATDVTRLLGGLTDIINGALTNLLGAVLTDIVELRGRDCAILNLELAPVTLNLLGLEVILDDCDGGPVLVDITARRGQLLGNLLCGLLHGGIGLGDLLEDILGALQAGG